LHATAAAACLCIGSKPKGANFAMLRRANHIAIED
jgi:hypothetical protein